MQKGVQEQVPLYIAKEYAQNTRDRWGKPERNRCWIGAFYKDAGSACKTGRDINTNCSKLPHALPDRTAVVQEVYGIVAGPDRLNCIGQMDELWSRAPLQ